MGDRELPVSNRTVHQRWLRYTSSLHDVAKSSQRSSIPLDPPPVYNFLSTRSKRNQVYSERTSTIERENLLLLDKMRHIMLERQNTDSMSEPFMKVSLNREKRKNELVKIMHENEALLKRIHERKPVYEVEKFEQQHAAKEYLLSKVGRFPYVSETMPNMTPPPLPNNRLVYYGTSMKGKAAGGAGTTTLPRIGKGNGGSVPAIQSQSARGQQKIKPTAPSSSSAAQSFRPGRNQPASSSNNKKSNNNATQQIYSDTITISGIEVQLTVSSYNSVAGLEFVATTTTTGESNAVPIRYALSEIQQVYGATDEQEKEVEEEKHETTTEDDAESTHSIPLSYFDDLPTHGASLITKLIPYLTWRDENDGKKQLILEGVKEEESALPISPSPASLLHTRIFVTVSNLPASATSSGQPPIAVLYARQQDTREYRQVAHGGLMVKEKSGEKGDEDYGEDDEQKESGDSSSSTTTYTTSLLLSHYSSLDGPLRMGFFEVNSQGILQPLKCIGECKWMIGEMMRLHGGASEEGECVELVLENKQKKTQCGSIQIRQESAEEEMLPQPLQQQQQHEKKEVSEEKEAEQSSSSPAASSPSSSRASLQPHPPSSARGKSPRSSSSSSSSRASGGKPQSSESTSKRGSAGEKKKAAVKEEKAKRASKPKEEKVEIAPPVEVEDAKEKEVEVEDAAPTKAEEAPAEKEVEPAEEEVKPAEPAKDAEPEPVAVKEVKEESKPVAAATKASDDDDYNFDDEPSPAKVEPVKQEDAKKSESDAPPAPPAAVAAPLVPTPPTSDKLSTSSRPASSTKRASRPSSSSLVKTKEEVEEKKEAVEEKKATPSPPKLEAAPHPSATSIIKSPPKSPFLTTASPHEFLDDDSVDLTSTARKRSTRLFQGGRTINNVDLLIRAEEGVPPSTEGENVDKLIPAILYHLYYRPTSFTYHHAISLTSLPHYLSHLTTPCSSSTLADQSEALIELFSVKCKKDTVAEIRFDGEALKEWKELKVEEEVKAVEPVTAEPVAVEQQVIEAAPTVAAVTQEVVTEKPVVEEVPVAAAPAAPVEAPVEAPIETPVEATPIEEPFFVEEAAAPTVAAPAVEAAPVAASADDDYTFEEVPAPAPAATESPVLVEAPVVTPPPQQAQVPEVVPDDAYTFEESPVVSEAAVAKDQVVVVPAEAETVAVVAPAVEAEVVVPAPVEAPVVAATPIVASNPESYEDEFVIEDAAAPAAAPKVEAAVPVVHEAPIEPVAEPVVAHEGTPAVVAAAPVVEAVHDAAPVAAAPAEAIAPVAAEAKVEAHAAPAETVVPTPVVHESTSTPATTAPIAPTESNPTEPAAPAPAPAPVASSTSLDDDFTFDEFE